MKDNTILQKNSNDVYVIAEISGNHGGNLSNAIELIKQSKAAGANAIKFQAYTPDSITLPSKKKDFLIPTNNAWEQHNNLYDLYKLAHTPFEWIPDLTNEAKKLEIPIFASVFDITSVNLLEEQSIFAYKIASPEVSDDALLKRVGETSKPVFISTGLSNLADIYRANEILMTNGATEIYWLKANTSYPPPISEINLKTIANMSEIFDMPVGFSDHTLGHVVTIAAVAAGARIIEKHIKLSESSTVDDFFSLNPREFKDMVEAIRTTQEALGKISYEIPESSKSYLNGKRSIYVSAPIKSGEKFTSNNVKSVRPSFSLPTHYLPLILKARAKRNLDIGDRIELKDLEIED